jgi:hypothetical protein
VSEFRSPLELRLITPWAHEGRGEWEFISDLIYYSDLLQTETIVYAGFRYDKASVPRLPLAFALFGERYARSAGVHDLLCRNRAIPRNIADKVFLEAMRVENEEELASLDGDEDDLRNRRAVLEGQALTMYAGVRVGAQF